MWRVYPPASGGKLRYKNLGPWLVLAKTSTVTYKIQRFAGAEPDIVHVDKLMLYQAGGDSCGCEYGCMLFSPQ